MDAMDRLCSACGHTYGEHGSTIGAFAGMCPIRQNGMRTGWHHTNLFRNAHMALKDVPLGRRVQVYGIEDAAATGNLVIGEKPTSWTYPATVVFHDIDKSTLLAFHLGELAPKMSVQAARYQQVWNNNTMGINKTGAQIDLSRYEQCIWHASSTECILLPATGSSAAVAISRDGRDGMNCKSCHTFCSYVVPNRGTDFVCFSCRQRGD